MDSAQSSFLLPAFIISESSRAILTFAVGKSGIHLSTTIVALGSELLKVVVAIVLLRRWIAQDPRYQSLSRSSAFKHAIFSGGGTRAEIGTALLSWRYIKFPLAYSVPACLYLINNLLYLAGVQITTVSMIHAIMFARVPCTAVLHHFVVKRQHSPKVWCALLAICFGLTVYAGSSTMNLRSGKASASKASTIGIAIGLIIAVVSSFASIYTEVLLKCDMAFCVAQFWLYLWGAVIAFAVSLAWNGQIGSVKYHTIKHTKYEMPPSPREIVGSHALIIVLTAVVGLLVANILRKRDNLVKLIGTSACVVSILALQTLLYPELWARSLSPLNMVGLGFITVGSWLYNSLISQPSLKGPEYTALVQEDNENQTSNITLPPGKMGKAPERNIFVRCQPVSRTVPTRARIVSVITAWILLTGMVWFLQAWALPYTNYKDTLRFFQPSGVEVHSWSNRNAARNANCIHEWVAQEEIKPNSLALENLGQSFIKSGSCPVYPIPDGGLTFHIFANGDYRPWIRVAIDSFLATQRLGDGHRLVCWIDENSIGNWDEAIEHYAQSDYDEFVSFVKFDPMREAAGTCLANMPEYMDEGHRLGVGMPPESWYELVRTLLLAKHGGIWIGPGTLLLRDLTPYIRAGPSVPGGAEATQWHDNLIVEGPPATVAAKALMRTVCSLSFDKSTSAARYPDIHATAWRRTYTDGLFQVCEEHGQCGYARMPMEWTDGSWAPEDSEDRLESCSDWEGDKPVPPTLHGIFAWRASPIESEDECVTDTSRQNAVQTVIRRIEQLLGDGLDMAGRDLFPGPGYAK